MKRRNRLIFCILMTAILTAQTSCGLFDQARLDHNRRLWRESGITSYRMSVDLQKTGHANPMGKFIITVRGGAVESIKLARDPEFVLLYDKFSKYDTIEDLFAVIETYQNDRQFWDKKEIAYDSQTGYPKKIHFDDFSAMDEEFFFEVLEFEVLERNERNN